VAPVVKLLSRLEEIKRLDLIVAAATEYDTMKMKMWHSSQTQGHLHRHYELMSDTGSLFLASRLGQFQRKAQTFPGWPNFKVL
jgi:hypothetical protein